MHMWIYLNIHDLQPSVTHEIKPSTISDRPGGFIEWWEIWTGGILFPSIEIGSSGSKRSSPFRTPECYPLSSSFCCHSSTFEFLPGAWSKIIAEPGLKTVVPPITARSFGDRVIERFYSISSRRIAVSMHIPLAKRFKNIDIYILVPGNYNKHTLKVRKDGGKDLHRGSDMPTTYRSSKRSSKRQKLWWVVANDNQHHWWLLDTSWLCLSANANKWQSDLCSSPTLDRHVLKLQRLLLARTVMSTYDFTVFIAYESLPWLGEPLTDSAQMLQREDTSASWKLVFMSYIGNKGHWICHCGW